MKALTWQGKDKVSVETVDDPTIQEPTDAIIEVTSSGVCGSDLHLISVLAPYMNEGDIMGHEPMGRVVEAGPASGLKKGDRVVIPFNISCGHCWMCERGLYSQCETTQVTEKGSGASLFGFSSLYGSVPGGQAQYLRVPHADFGAIKVGNELPDHRYVFLSDVLPTAWQGVKYTDVSEGDTIAVYGLGPIGQMGARMARHMGARVFGIDPVPERREMALRHGIEVFEGGEDTIAQIRDLTDGRGPDAVLDAVGMEAHGSPVGGAVQAAVGALPEGVAQKVMETVGIDRLNVLHDAIDLVRRGGTISLSGVYAGAASPMPLLNMFDKQIQLREGQCNVKKWIDDLLPLVEDPSDPLGVDDLVTHRVPLSEGPDAYKKFRDKEDDCIKVVLDPVAS